MNSGVPLEQGRVILIKANVCRILGPKLKYGGSNVPDNDQVVYFLNPWHQKKFDAQFRGITRTLQPAQAAKNPV